LYVAPTGVRIIKKMDYDGEWVKKYDVSSLESFSVVGERCDPDTMNWIHRHFPNALKNDTWWQTETGTPMAGNLLNTKQYGPIFPTLPGSVGKPCPGFNLQILNDKNEECAPNELGKVSIKLPMPPAFMLTLWGNDEAFIKKYLSESPGFYTTGDAGVVDERGYVHIMTRVDDVINTAGHRISTGRLEEVVNDHADVVESAVVGFNDPIRGECPLAFIILRGSQASLPPAEEARIKKEVGDKIRADVGAFAKLIDVIIMQALPKTKSGKILRGTIKSIVNQAPWKMPATLDDPESLTAIEKSTAAWLADMKAKQQK